MKTSLLLMMCILAGFATTAYSQIFNRYRHKSEAEIRQMTASQRVDEWIKELAHHQSSAHNFDVDDKHDDLVKKYIYLDKFEPIPRILEIINSFDFKRDIKNQSRSFRFSHAVDLLRFIDGFNIRIRSSAEGMPAIDALENAVKRMRAAGYVTTKEKPAEEESGDRHSLLEIGIRELESLRGVNNRDLRIQDTFRVTYKTKLSDADLLEFSNFLTTRNPDYPSWSEAEPYMDTLPNGNLLRIFILREPERYYEAYKEFTKTSSNKNKGHD